MKRKVQAQRKFALGAFIPPSLNNNNTIHRAETHTQPKEDRNIIQNNISAKKLLDIVSYQGIHTHSKPIVLLEKLADTKENQTVTTKLNVIEVKEKPVPVTPNKHPLTPKSKAKNSTMCLRSGSGTLDKKERKSNGRCLRNRQKYAQVQDKKETPKKKRPVVNLETLSDLDDETPLKFFKTALGKKNAADSPVTKNQKKKEVIPSKEASPPKDCDQVFKTPLQLPAENLQSKPAEASNAKQYYGRNRIEGWIDSVQSPAKYCPSERHESIANALNAPLEERETYCKNCDRCVSMIMAGINKYILAGETNSATSLNTEKNDVYDFDADRDAQESTPLIYKRKQKNTGETDDEHIYLDLLPQDNPHIIQLKSVKLPNQDKSIMRARLILRSEVNKNQDISLVQHDGLLNKILVGMVPPIADMTVKNATPKTTTTQETIKPTELVKEPEEANDTKKVQLKKGVSVKTPIQPVLEKAETLKKIKLKNKQLTTRGVKYLNGFRKKVKPLWDKDEKKKLLEISKVKNVEANSIPKAKVKPVPSKCCKETSTIKTRSKTPEKVTPSEAQDSEAGPSNASPPNYEDIEGIVEAPTYHLTEDEFNDPIALFEKVMPAAAKYGLCKVVAPQSFNPKCIINDNIKFKVSNQYIARLYSRWGPAAKEMCAIKAYLATQNVQFWRAPLLEGIELDLPKLYHIVQRHGGLMEVIEKKRWSKVADEMRITKWTPNPEKALDKIYCKHLLPYDTLSDQERTQMMAEVETCWKTRNRKLKEWALNPLHRTKKLMGESESSDDEEEQKEHLDAALFEAEDCVVSGRYMNLARFKKVAFNLKDSYFGSSKAICSNVEKEYWRLVLQGSEHVSVNSASVDTGNTGLGFAKKNEPSGRHPWNLKMLSQNSGNVLRSLGAVLGVTVPTLHLGMVFSTSCWHRDPHGLPWVEYMHSGPPKIWYGIPNEQSAKFRKAVEKLCPTWCQNKSVWLPSDVTMIPPALLKQHGVSLSRITQKPGEFILVFPKAYSCSISTGFTVSESVYFATDSWLKGVQEVFEELSESCEPTTFSLEQLALALARDESLSPRVLRLASDLLRDIRNIELERRRQWRNKRLSYSYQAQPKKKHTTTAAWNVREQDECEVCRSTLYLSKVTGVPSKKSSLCLGHALRILNSAKQNEIDSAAASLLIYYSDEELDSIVNDLQDKV